jgi:hypothetical protein
MLKKEKKSTYKDPSRHDSMFTPTQQRGGQAVR